MRIRNLLVLTITIVVGTLSVSGQDRNGSTTFTDQSNRSITISRFGTVLNFKNGDGKEAAPANTYRVCPCGEKAGCIESATIPDDKANSKFEVEFPKKGTMLNKSETLVVRSTFRHGDLTVERRLSWAAGSNLVKIDEVISSPKSLCPCALEEKQPVKVLLDMKMCPRPPIPGFICPPYSELSSDAMKQMTLATLLSF